jgi:hypothetical protein
MSGESGVTYSEWQQEFKLDPSWKSPTRPQLAREDGSCKVESQHSEILVVLIHGRSTIELPK